MHDALTAKHRGWPLDSLELFVEMRHLQQSLKIRIKVPCRVSAAGDWDYSSGTCEVSVEAADINILEQFCV